MKNPWSISCRHRRRNGLAYRDEKGVSKMILGLRNRRQDVLTACSLSGDGIFVKKFPASKDGRYEALWVLHIVPDEDIKVNEDK